MSHEVLLTAEGLEKLKAELLDLKTRVRSNIAEAIKEAKSHGDLRENAAYHEAKLNQQRNDSRIADLERAVLKAKVVSRPDSHGAMAHLGSTVTLIDLEFDDEFDVELVGSFEADPANNKISIASPLGEALLGKEPGDSLQVEAPDGLQKYKVKNVTT